MITTALALLFVLGFTAQQTGVCMVRAAKEVIYHKRVNRFAGFTLSALVAMIALIAASNVINSENSAYISGYGASWWAVLGGALFATGARINGRCATGTAVALTSGKIYHLATVAGMILVACIAHAFLLPELLSWQSNRLSVPSPLTHAAPALLIPIAVLFCALLAWYLHRYRPQPLPYHHWPPIVAMTILGITSGVLYALDMRWTYTALIADATYGEVQGWLGHILAVVILVSGLFVGAWWKNNRREDPESISYGTAKQWLTSLIGGGFMGAGATFVPGGNDTMLYTGIPLLLPNLLAGYIAMLVVLHMSLVLFPNSKERAETYQQQ